MNAKRAEKLKRLGPALESMRAAVDARSRMAADPIEFPHRYEDPRDIEVSALLASALAYGRVDLFKPKVGALLESMGSQPSRFLAKATLEDVAERLNGFVYRFNLAADIGVLWLGMGWALREHGSLESLFVQGLEATGSWPDAMRQFSLALREIREPKLETVLGPTRGLDHLLPSGVGQGAAKRLNLFLRWMVRGPDGVDFGIWNRVSAANLVIPLDTHIHRMARHLGLTKRNDAGWKTAAEITDALRAIAPDDPVKFDFALCHFGMSGACPLKPRASVCHACVLRSECATGKRVTASPRARAAS